MKLFRQVAPLSYARDVKRLREMMPPASYGADVKRLQELMPLARTPVAR
ncbi:MAG TPA: hypothetical protein VE975_04625 [Actinomycetota bacterium]|nr:hypothetical protein [Actinomycetota bacterium]